MDRLTKIINTVLENNQREPIQTIDIGMSLRNDIGFDSLDLAELTVRIEAEFGVDVFEDSIVDTVSEIIQKIDSIEKP